MCALLLLVASAGSASAADLIGEYRAYISERDLFNSSGDRLTAPWQIIRQDRANYHRFGNADPDDQYDDFFASAENRAIMERMLMRGTISPSAARAVVDGDVFLRVRIYGRGTRGEFVNVEVE